MTACCESCWWRRERRDEQSAAALYCAHSGETLTEARVAALEAEPYQYGHAPCPTYLAATEAQLWHPR